MSVDGAAYAQVVREARDGGVELERFREPMGDTAYTRFAVPVAAGARDPEGLAAAAEVHPGIEAGDGHVTLVDRDRMLMTYDLDDGSVTLPGDTFYAAVQDRDPGRGVLGTATALIAGRLNPLYRRGRATAAEQELAEDGPEWTTRHARTAYGVLALTAAAAVSGGYGLLAGEPTFFDIGVGSAIADVGFMGTYGAYTFGGIEAMLEQVDSRNADAIDDRAGDTIVHADTSRVIDAWLDSIDPDAETPGWLDR